MPDDVLERVRELAQEAIRTVRIRRKHQPRANLSAVEVTTLQALVAILKETDPLK
jgi:hypothetical protein